MPLVKWVEDLAEVLGTTEKEEISSSVPCLGLARKIFASLLRLLFFLTGKLLVLLIDGRKLLGTLRSFDKYSNVVLEGACERVIVGELYCDMPLGWYIIRGANVVLIGELDMNKEELPPHMTSVSEAEIRRAQKAEREAADLKGSMRKRMEFLDFD
ncbi:Sm-like protein lsm1b [Ancistrocladus abbreviatus]